MQNTEMNNESQRPSILQDIKPQQISPVFFPITGFFIGLIFWCMDAFIDVYILDEEQTFFENLVMPDESTELWMRSLVIIVFTIMGFFSYTTIRKHIKLDKLLFDYQHKLESIVSEKTEELEIKNKELEKLANVDLLTCLYNRRKITEILEAELKRFNRHNVVFSLMFLDIDYFKKINDTYGHDVGDIVLKGFADLLVSNVRSVDNVGRWGGEEFLIVLIESDSEKAKIVAEKIQANLSNVSFDQVGKITASIGISEATDEDTLETIIKRADEALYRAKDLGRNRIETS